MIGHLCLSVLTVHRPSTVSDGMGGQTVTFTAGGQIRAQVSQPTTEERMLAQRAGTDLSHVIHAPVGADVHRGDHLDGDLPSDVPDGSRLRVIAVISNSRSTYTRIECEVTQPEGGAQ